MEDPIKTEPPTNTLLFPSPSPEIMIITSIVDRINESLSEAYAVLHVGVPSSSAFVVTRITPKQIDIGFMGKHILSHHATDVPEDIDMIMIHDEIVVGIGDAVEQAVVLLGAPATDFSVEDNDLHDLIASTLKGEFYDEVLELNEEENRIGDDDDTEDGEELLFEDEEDAPSALAERHLT